MPPPDAAAPKPRRDAVRAEATAIIAECCVSMHVIMYGTMQSDDSLGQSTTLEVPTTNHTNYVRPLISRLAHLRAISARRDHSSGQLCATLVWSLGPRRGVTCVQERQTTGTEGARASVKLRLTPTHPTILHSNQGRTTIIFGHAFVVMDLDHTAASSPRSHLDQKREAEPSQEIHTQLGLPAAISPGRLYCAVGPAVIVDYYAQQAVAGTGAIPPRASSQCGIADCELFAASPIHKIPQCHYITHVHSF
ncbi:hypothetical protein CONLIGDRAFT_646719 [Coniochaeta ligniaria NRRL 30616]|uniref:Uncharacterized protein n=1 Tax=Coniochaeta ligniaria NRRL 30616 TaxID=1408157 RepID=A0A1J7J9U7_9PEZI|nr:hypothetical protein CONLIGDRAFT_646719 [Coniochaeta ligniaria NRRL 30616]